MPLGRRPGEFSARSGHRIISGRSLAHHWKLNLPFHLLLEVGGWDWELGLGFVFRLGILNEWRGDTYYVGGALLEALCCEPDFLP